MWIFDLRSLHAVPYWEHVDFADKPVPSRRTGHTLTAHNDKLYLFGGTDHSLHYNDTWCFDICTRTWAELDCLGNIPRPRQSHSSAIVDDTIYVFGGRGVDGHDLGDSGNFVAFRTSNQMWYSLQSMRPAPSGRYGHAMATYGSKVFILGGQSLLSRELDKFSHVHVLDTSTCHPFEFYYFSCSLGFTLVQNTLNTHPSIPRQKLLPRMTLEGQRSIRESTRKLLK